MTKYPKYKPTNIEWIKNIPAHWELRKLKYIVNDKLMYGANEIAESENPINPRYIRITDFGDDGNLRKDTFKSLASDIAKDFLLCEGDILFARSGATVGKTFQFKNYNGIACFAGYLIKASPNILKINSDYLYYYTKSGTYENWKNSIFNQSTIQNIGADKYSLLEISIPPLQEQTLIANFLDEKTEKIDKLIETKKKLIELLKEERTAIINNAVTKGMNPKAKLKPSGIEWLGDIPEHWEVKKLKYVAKINLGKMLTNDDKGDFHLKPYLRAANLQWLEVDVNDIKEMWFSSWELEKLRLFENDLLVSEGGEVGRTAIWKNEIEECYIQNSVHKVTILNPNISKFFLFQFYVNGQKGIFDSIVNRISIAHLTVEKIREIIFLVPNYIEQKEIVEFIEAKTQKIDITISKIEKEIELMKEYRTSLVSEVVTGKVKVF